LSRCNRESVGRPTVVRSYLTAAALVLPAALLTVPMAASAAPRLVESFDAGTWAGWQQSLRRPAIVVFTTTDCAHCPAALAEIERQRRSHTPRAELLVVVMDGESDDASLLQQAHYRSADRLLAFDGPANRLRHSVNPGWIGVTPYVALLAGAAAPKFVMGVPDMAAWNSFYASR
jgi:hypothetical protein